MIGGSLGSGARPTAPGVGTIGSGGVRTVAPASVLVSGAGGRVVEPSLFVRPPTMTPISPSSCSVSLSCGTFTLPCACNSPICADCVNGDIACGPCTKTMPI